MVDISNNKWTQLDDGNITSSPDGVQGGYQPSTIAPIIRNIRGAVKREYVSSNPVYTSTGSANVYAISFEQPLEITKGKRISFIANVTNTGASTINLNTAGAVAIVRRDGTALQAGDIIANMPVDIVYDGNRYVLQSSPNLSNYSGTIKATAFDGNGAALTALNATNISSGTLNNARLPTTMTGKTFSSAVSISEGGIAINGTSSIDGARIVTTADYGPGKGLDADTLDGEQKTWYQNRDNHSGTQSIATISGLQAIIDNLSNLINDPWATQPLGVLIAGNSGVDGWQNPPTNKAYKYIILNAGASEYHGNMIVNENVSGTWPNVNATGVINCPGSRFHGKTVRLINTERRFLRAGSAGELQQDQLGWHQHGGQTNDAGWHGHQLPGNVWSNDPNTATGSNYVQPSGSGYYNNNIGNRWTHGDGNHSHSFTTNGTGGEETRVKNIGVNYFMRIL